MSPSPISDRIEVERSLEAAIHHLSLLRSAEPGPGPQARVLAIAITQTEIALAVAQRAFTITA